MKRYVEGTGAEKKELINWLYGYRQALRKNPLSSSYNKLFEYERLGGQQAGNYDKICRGLVELGI